jgi:pyrroline-5-carboxylate reductase
MGEALAAGLLAAGWAPDRVIAAARRETRRTEVERRLGIRCSLDVREAVDGAEIVVVAVKPRDVPGLVSAMRGVLHPSQVLVSLAAGVPTSTYEEALAGIPVVRAMPNTPALVGEGVTGIAPGSSARPGDVEKARKVLEAVGEVHVLEESLLDAVTAVSGTGPAYVFLLAEALIEAAIREGLPRDVAEALVRRTIRGAGHLLTDIVKAPAELRADVTSPGGTTAAAVHVLEEGGFRALVEDAVRAAARRSRELGRGEG